MDKDCRIRNAVNRFDFIGAMMGYNSPTDLNGWLALASPMGLDPSNFVPQPMWDMALTVAKRNIKESKSPTQAQIYELQACIIMRGLVYWHNSPGDCGYPSQIDFTNSQIAGAAGNLASGIAGMAGATIPGIGAAVQAIQQIFAHHSQAVANEQATLCSVAGVINRVIPYYDNQVRLGYISPSTGYRGVQNFIAQVNAQMQTIFQQCNAACVYMSFLAAHSDFLTFYYPAIAPVQIAAHAPGAPPTSIIPTPPGGVIQVGNLYGGGLSTVAIPPLVQSSPIYIPQAAPIPATLPPTVQPAQSNAMLIGIVVVIGIIVLALAMG